MQIRNYQPTDKAQLLALFRLNCPAAFATEEEQDFSDYLDHEREDYFVLEAAGKICACGGINYPDGPGKARISWDMVHPENQGQGLGKQLLQYRLDFIRQKGKIETVSVRTSQLAFRFYEQAGFRLVETVPDYWAKGFDLYRMELRL